MFYFWKLFFYQKKKNKKSESYQRKKYLKKFVVVKSGFLKTHSTFLNSSNLNFHFIYKNFIKFFFFLNIYCLAIHSTCKNTTNFFFFNSRDERGLLKDELSNLFFFKSKICTAFGSCLFLEKENYDFIRVKLPSGVYAVTYKVFLKKAVRGKSKNLNKFLKKFSKNFFYKTKVSVRGVAKNANEHYNGGKGGGAVLRGFVRW